MYDITKFSSINNVEKWIMTIRTNLCKERNRIPIIMVGGKCDLYSSRTVPEKYAEKVANKYKFFNYFECSSKTGENIDKLFKFLTLGIMNFDGYI